MIDMLMNATGHVVSLATFSSPRMFPEINDGMLTPLLVAGLVIGYLLIAYPPKRF